MDFHTKEKIKEAAVIGVVCVGLVILTWPMLSESIDKQIAFDACIEGWGQCQ